VICRVAESCFWLHRYMERVDNTARLAHVNLDLLLDAPFDPLDSWRPLLIVMGEEPRFLELHGADAVRDEEQVQEYLVWDPRNPSSILNSAFWARENARTLREVISREAWECVNELWLWLDGRSGRRLYRRDAAEFYERLKETALLFRGTSADTMLHDQPMDFMRLGLHLERAGQTARILDVRHHTLGRDRPAPEGAPLRVPLLFAILRTCGAIEPFFKRGRVLDGAEVAEFLILDGDFPRGVLHCLIRSASCVERIRRTTLESEPGIGEESARRLQSLRESLSTLKPAEIGIDGVHSELTRLIDETARIGEAVHGDFFEPNVPEDVRGGSSLQSQSQN
jgi:uncharacterized alpha-E superfamily protein